MFDSYESLTKGEKEVYGLIKEGMTNNKIAKVLGVSIYAVKYHVKNVLSKYGIHDRKKLIAKG